MKRWLQADAAGARLFMGWPFAAGFFVVLGAVGFLPIPDFFIAVLTISVIYAVVAASWDFLVGYSGQLCFGQAAFFAVGGYSSALLSGKLDISPWIAAPLGALAAMLVGLAFSLPALRLRGPYLALTTLALAETVRIVLLSWTDLTRGDLGFSTFPGFPGIPYSRVNYYYVALVFAALSFLVLYLTAERTRFGLACRALRDDELRARTLGMNAVFYKAVAFAISAFVAGAAGAIYAHEVNVVHPNISSITISGYAVVMAVLGGRGTIFGSLLGALVLVHLSQYLRVLGVVFNDIGTGVALLAVLWFVPDGILGFAQRSVRGLVPRLTPNTVQASLGADGAGSNVTRP